MALIECVECKKEVSDKAAACPNCGAPIRLASTPPVPTIAVTTSNAQKKQTHFARWFVLLAIIAAAIWYIPKAQREANLPAMPVEVQYRPALLGPGLVLKVKNTSSRHLSLLVTLKNPSTAQTKTYRLDAAPSATVEVGHKEGWVLASGDQFSITHNDYKTWSGSIP